jgi:hypothetical protein
VTQPHVSPSSTAGDETTREVRPVTVERIERALTARGYAFVEDPEHPEVLRARFDDHRFQFSLSSESHDVLQVRGRWKCSVDASRKAEMLRLCNEWNMNRIWPKVYARREADGALGLYGEVAADFRSGASDAQIDRAIDCGLHTVIAFFQELRSRLDADREEARV